jgi:vancomycin resistance protein YoaR
VSTRLVLPILIGVVVVIAAVASLLYVQRGAHIELRGEILKVRTHELDAASSIAVVDFRFRNPADYPFIVRTVDVSIELKDGRTVEGQVVAEADTERVFQALPLLGQKYNRSLLAKDRVNARESLDRMIAARFEVPVSMLQERRQLSIRIEDVDGPVSTLLEKARPKN